MEQRRGIYRAAAAVLAAAALAACSGGADSAITNFGSSRHPLFNLGSTQATVTGAMIQPLTLTVTGSTGALALFGSTECGAAAGSNPCPNVNFTATPPQWSSVNALTLTMNAATLNVPCTAPAGAPTPAPGFVPACYIVAYEGGVGPYVIQGPAATNNGSLSFSAETSPLYLNGGNTAYNFFVAYVTSMSATPPPPTPTPSPVPTSFNTPLPPTPTPAACPDRDRGHHYGWKRPHGDDICDNG